MFSKFWLSCFSIFVTPSFWYRIHESSVYKTRVDVTASGILLMYIRNNRDPKMDPSGTPQEIFLKSEILFSVFARNILSERKNLNRFISAFWETYCFTFSVTKSYYQFCQMPSVDQLISFQLTNHRQTLLKLRKGKLRLVEWLPRKHDWELYNIASSDRNTFVCSQISLSMFFKIDGSNEIIVGRISFFLFLKIYFQEVLFKQNSTEIMKLE